LCVYSLTFLLLFYRNHAFSSDGLVNYNCITTTVESTLGHVKATFIASAGIYSLLVCWNVPGHPSASLTKRRLISWICILVAPVWPVSPTGPLAPFSPGDPAAPWTPAHT